MNYQQDRDEAAENFATKNQTAIFIAGNTHQGTLNGFINGSDFGKQWEEERVKALIQIIVEKGTYDSINWCPEMETKEDLCLLIKKLDEEFRAALKAYEEGK